MIERSHVSRVSNKKFHHDELCACNLLHSVTYTIYFLAIKIIGIIQAKKLRDDEMRGDEIDRSHLYICPSRVLIFIYIYIYRHSLRIRKKEKK